MYKTFVFLYKFQKNIERFSQAGAEVFLLFRRSIKTPFTSSHTNMQGCEGREGQKQVFFYLFRPIHQSIILQFIVYLQIFAVENPVASVPIERNKSTSIGFTNHTFIESGTRQVVSFLSLFVGQCTTDSGKFSDDHRNALISKSFFQLLEL